MRGRTFAATFFGLLFAATLAHADESKPQPPPEEPPPPQPRDYFLNAPKGGT